MLERTMTSTFSDASFSSVGATVGDPVTEPFAMRPRIVLFQPESPGFIEWIVQLFRFLFGVFVGLFLTLWRGRSHADLKPACLEACRQ